MRQELIELNTSKPIVKVFLVASLIGASIWSFYAVRWYLGNTLAEYFDVNEGSLEGARMAGSLAPNDPLTHWRIADVSQKHLPLDQRAEAIPEFEKAVSLSPNDYRFWVALGIAYEQADEIAKGEHALRRAVTLAPAYSFPRWYLGNLLLRNERYDEAFAELRAASEADPELRPQIFNFIWQIYGEDFEKLKYAAGHTAIARAQFARYLIQQNRLEDGLRLWDSLKEEEKKANKPSGELIVSDLKNSGRYQDAMKVWNDIVSNDIDRAEQGRILDGGFEESAPYGQENVFGWQVKGGPQLQIGIDPAKSHNGRRSLRLVFQVRSNLESMNVSQLVPVKAETQYDFEYYLRTEKLESGSTPEVQIVDASDASVLVSSDQAPNGTTDWTRVGLSFKTGPKTEAVTLKIRRVSCSNDQTPVCPIFGSLWYDDFSFRARN
jgi:tetratricopeptide (TPR) repeat protein